MSEIKVDALSTVSGSGNLTVDTDTLVIDTTNEKIGINQASPTYQLTVKAANQSTVEIESASTTGESRLYMTDPDSTGVGEIGYYHNGDTMRFNTGGAERMRLSSAGLHIGGTGAANALDDYEEGNWTPVLDFGGGSTGITYGTQSARYTKIGRMVYFSFRIYLTSKGSSTGHAHVSGFPFTVANMPTGGVFQLIPARGWLSNNDEPIYLYVADGGTRLALYYNDWDASANSAATHGSFANNTELELTAFYFT